MDSQNSLDNELLHLAESLVEDPNECNHGNSEVSDLNDPLQLLCDQVEVENYKEQRQKEIKEMNKRMDAKLTAIREEKEKLKESKLIEEASKLKETYSGLLLSKRLLNQDDIDIYTSAREFLPLETLDQIITLNSTNLRAFFTIGVIVELSGPIISKNGKVFSIIKISDLVKYDLLKVKKMLELKHSGNNEEAKEMIKLSEKCYGSNGYKTLKLMCFGDSASWATKLNTGTVIGLLNPKPMKSSVDQGLTFCLELEQQIFKIGYSEELGFCKGLPKSSVVSTGSIPGMQMLQVQQSCKNFLNKSIEQVCDFHRSFLTEQKLARIRSHRIGLHSDFIDINKLRKQQELEERERMIGAFSGKGKGFKDVKQPVMSPKAKARMEAQHKKEVQNFNSFLKDRTLLTQKAQPKKNFIAGLTCKETQHLGKACVPGQGTAQLQSGKIIGQKIEGVQPQKEKRLFAQVNTLLGPKKQQGSQEEFEIEIVGGTGGLGLREMISKKMTHDERFPTLKVEAEDLRRKKIQ